MTIYSQTKEVYKGLPYAFRCRVFGKYDEEFIETSPNRVNKSYTDLTDYDGLDYYKESIISPNVTIVGSPTISSDMEVSGFSASKYLTIPPTFSDSDNWEIMVEFKSSSASATGHFFSSMAGAAGQYAGVDISLSSGKLMLQLGINGSSFQKITATSAVTANTWYWVKVTFQYSQFLTSVCSFDYSTDGVNFTNIGTLTPSSRIYKSLVTRIGVYGNKVEGQASTVTINLNNCYVKIDNETVWRGIYQQGTIIDFANTKLPWKWGYQSMLKTSKYAVGSQNQSYIFYGNTLNGTIIGTPSISTDRLMSGFSEDNYITVLPQWNPLTNPWKIHLRVTTGSGTNDILFGQPTTNRTTPQLALVNKVLKIYLASSTSAWDISSGDSCSIELEPNNTYDVDVEFTGTTYTISVDGVIGLTINNSTPVYSGNYPFILGYDHANNPFTGSIHLGESYITINGEEVWRGFDKQVFQGVISGDTDQNGEYNVYAIDGDDHIELVKKTDNTIDTSATNPRYLGTI